MVLIENEAPPPPGPTASTPRTSFLRSSDVGDAGAVSSDGGEAELRIAH